MKTVGAMLIVSGAVFLTAALRKRFSLEILAVGTGLVLAAIDIIYSLPGRIHLVYLRDALVELVIIAVLLKGYQRR